MAKMIVYLYVNSAFPLISIDFQVNCGPVSIMEHHKQFVCGILVRNKDTRENIIRIRQDSSYAESFLYVFLM